MEIEEADAQIGHEATVSKVGDDRFYLMSRGLTEQQATAMIVAGFIEPIVRELPDGVIRRRTLTAHRTADGRVGRLRRRLAPTDGRPQIADRSSAICYLPSTRHAGAAGARGSLPPSYPELIFRDSAAPARGGAACRGADRCGCPFASRVSTPTASTGPLVTWSQTGSISSMRSVRTAPLSIDMGRYRQESDHQRGWPRGALAADLLAALDETEVRSRR